MERMDNSVDSRPINIFVVEDDDGDAKAVMRAFKQAKLANPVYRAVDGVQALEILRGDNPPPSPFIMLVDLKMPRMNGIQLVEELRKDPRYKRQVVFILTTSKSEEDKSRAYDLNVAGYILKETAGRDFLELVSLLGNYWRVVELPE
mgnify:CR=1 FL=1